MRVSYANAFMSVGIAAAITVAICLTLERRQVEQQARLLAAHQQNLTAQQEQFALRDVNRQIDARDATVQRQRRFYEEMLAALGGPVAAALKHPDLAILGALQQLARACAPDRSVPHATVDRFTEFTVYIDLPAPQSRPALAEIARCFLSQSAAYVNTLQFNHDGAVIALLDRRAIESITDWKNAQPSAVEKALIDPEFSQPPSFVGAVAPAAEQQHPPELHNLPEEARRQRDAEQRFAEAFRRADSQLHAALERQGAAINFAGVMTVSDFDERRRMLIQAESVAAEAKRVLANPVGEYERILQAQKLDPLYVRAAVRTASLAHTNARPAVAKVFDAFEARSRSAAEILAVMKRHFGSWIYQPFSDRIDFHDPAAQADHAAAAKKFDAASRALQVAVEDWVRAYKDEREGKPGLVK